MSKVASTSECDIETGSIAYFVTHLGILKSLGLPLTLKNGEGEAVVASTCKSVIKCLLFTYVVAVLLQGWQVSDK